MGDVFVALRCIALNAAGVITTNEGFATCKIVLNSAGKALPKTHNQPIVEFLVASLVQR